MESVLPVQWGPRKVAQNSGRETKRGAGEAEHRKPGGQTRRSRPEPLLHHGTSEPPRSPQACFRDGTGVLGCVAGEPQAQGEASEGKLWACASRRWCPAVVLGARAGARPQNWEAQPVAGAEGVVRPRRPGWLGEWPVPGAPSSGLWVHSMLSQLHPGPGMARKVSQGAGVGAPAGIWAVCVSGTQDLRPSSRVEALEAR